MKKNLNIGHQGLKKPEYKKYVKFSSNKFIDSYCRTVIRRTRCIFMQALFVKYVCVTSLPCVGEGVSQAAQAPPRQTVTVRTPSRADVSSTK